MSDTKEVLEQTLIQQIAGLALQNTPAHKIAEQLGITRYKCEKIIKSTEFKAFLRELGDRAAEAALAAYKSKLDTLEPLAFAALKHNLQDKKLEAVRLWGEHVGLNKKQDAEQKDTAIQIILPGGLSPEKSVESEVIEIETGGKSDES